MDKEIWKLSDEEYDRANPPPLNLVAGEDGKPYAEFVEDDNWMWMGYVPTPKSRLGWFFHHILHGLMMHYPIHKVLLFAIFHTKGEADKFGFEVIEE